MHYHLNIDWTTPTGEAAPAALQDLEAVLYGPISSTATSLNNLPQQKADISEKRLRFAHLSSGFYALLLRYNWQDQYYSSYYFGLDIPDITLIQLTLHPGGSQVEQMGTLNDYGDFIDQRLEEESLYLTRPLSEIKALDQLGPLLMTKPDFEQPQIRETLNQHIGPLKEGFIELQFLWAYQLRALLSPTLLKHTSPEALACLQHLLSNHLALMDDESLFEHLQLAIEATGQEEQVEDLLNMLSWNPDTGNWDGMGALLKALKNSTFVSASE